MDGTRFDRLARQVAGEASRRNLLKGVLGLGVAGVAGLAGGGSGSAAALRKPGEICRKNGECASGICGQKGATGRQRCGCTADAQCGAGVCTNGACEQCPQCYAPSGGGCVRVQDPMNGRCPCGFEETGPGHPLGAGQCVKNQCKDCFENVGGICVPEAPGTAPNGLCNCGQDNVGGICVPRYPLP